MKHARRTCVLTISLAGILVAAMASGCRAPTRGSTAAAAPAATDASERLILVRDVRIQRSGGLSGISWRLRINEYAAASQGVVATPTTAITTPPALSATARLVIMATAEVSAPTMNRSPAEAAYGVCRSGWATDPDLPDFGTCTRDLNSPEQVAAIATALARLDALGLMAPPKTAERIAYEQARARGDRTVMTTICNDGDGSGWWMFVFVGGDSVAPAVTDKKDGCGIPETDGRRAAYVAAVDSVVMRLQALGAGDGQRRWRGR